MGGSVCHLDVSLLALGTVPAALRLLGLQGEEEREGDALTLCIFPSTGMWRYGTGSSPGSTTHSWNKARGVGGDRQHPSLSLVLL